MQVTRIDRKPTPVPGTPPTRHAMPGDGSALLDALPWPCIVFACDGGDALTCNAAFRSEFPHWANALPARATFEAAFEGIGDPADKPMVYAPDSRRWYHVEHSELDMGMPAEAVFLSNMSDCIIALRRHRQQHEQLLSTSRMMSVGEMATTLAHELNQPLAAAINYLGGCEQILDQEPAHATLLQGVRLARRQTERAAQIIGSIREFVRSREPHREKVDAVALVHGVIELLRLEAEQFQVGIVNALPRGLPPIFADRVMIEQVLLNLIKNAIEAMRDTPPSRRRITVSARIDDDDMVELRVVDQGCGIDEDGMRQLFTPLYTTKQDGLGIGLAICRSIVEYHEGRLFAEPNAEGDIGCALVFTVPRGDIA